MQNKTVVIINGKPRSGKNTFCDYIVNYCEEKGIFCDVWSTIDFEKEILEEIVNREYDPNNDIDRTFLSDFKQLCNECYDITFRDFKNLLMFYEGIFLVHTREWNEILRFQNYCKENDIKFITVFMSSKNEKDEFTNYSDKFCDNKKNMYDVKIENNGSLEDLEENAKQFCESRLF
jgi:uridine kinase